MVCRCGMVQLDGIGPWLVGGPGIRAQLQQMARQRDAEKANEEAMLTSDINDPRWTRLDVD